MDNLNVRNYESLKEVTGALEQIISGDQPFQRVLTALRDNTRSLILPEKLDESPCRGSGRTGLAIV
jgi:type VI secretion system protein ImpL